MSVSLGAFLLQLEARVANHEQVVEEDKRSKLPSNWAAKQERLRKEKEYDEKKEVRVC